MSYTLEERVRFGYFGGNPMKKYVFLTLAAYADSDGANAFPSIGTLAGVMECSERTIQNKLRELEDEGFIVRQPTERWNGLPQHQRPNPYRIVVDQVPKVARKDVRKHLEQIAEQDSKDPAGGAGVSEGGVQEVHPTQSMYSISSSSSVDSSYNSSDDDERDSEERRDGGEEPRSTITDEESPTLEGSNSQIDPSPVTAPRPAVAESISVAAPPGTGETTRPPVEESPPAKAPGPQIDTQQLQNPDPKARNEWRPSSAAYEQARAVAPDVNLELVIVSYWMWTFEKKIDPSNTHWMRWVIGEQKKHDAQREKEREQQALAQRQEKPWYEKELKL